MKRCAARDEPSLGTELNETEAKNRHERSRILYSHCITSIDLARCCIALYYRSFHFQVCMVKAYPTQGEATLMGLHFQNAQYTRPQRDQAASKPYLRIAWSSPSSPFFRLLCCYSPSVVLKSSFFSYSMKFSCCSTISQYSIILTFYFSTTHIGKLLVRRLWYYCYFQLILDLFFFAFFSIQPSRSPHNSPKQPPILAFANTRVFHSLSTAFLRFHIYPLFINSSSLVALVMNVSPLTVLEGEILSYLTFFTIPYFTIYQFPVLCLSNLEVEVVTVGMQWW